MIGENEYLSTEFTLGGIQFRVNKLSAMRGFDLFESIRKELALTLDGVKLGDTQQGDDDGSMALIKGIMQLETSFVSRLRDVLFSNCEFKGNGAETFVTLGGAEDMAFQDLEPIDIYEVLLRCLTVNFIGSFRGLQSKSQGLKSILK